jgi:hypothetical protein
MVIRTASLRRLSTKSNGGALAFGTGSCVSLIVIVMTMQHNRARRRAVDDSTDEDTGGSGRSER